MKTRNGFVSNSSSCSFVVKSVTEDFKNFSLNVTNGIPTEKVGNGDLNLREDFERMKRNNSSRFFNEEI